jgi:uncharacterized membrane protein YkoI
MQVTPKKAAIALAASAAAAVGAVGIADAASHKKHHTKRHSAASTSTRSNSETVLTGANAQSAKDAALAAVPGGKVTRASTEDPKDASGAAYEVHVTKSDGSEVEVLEDSAFKVLSTKASPQHGGPDGRGHDGPGHGGPGNPAETELTGADAQSAKDAALAAVPGGTVERASKEDPKDASGAAYEVHVTKSDGSEVEVLEDSAFKVLSTKAGPQHGGPGGHRH